MSESGSRKSPIGTSGSSWASINLPCTPLDMPCPPLDMPGSHLLLPTAPPTPHPGTLGGLENLNKDKASLAGRLATFGKLNNDDACDCIPEDGAEAAGALKKPAASTEEDQSQDCFAASEDVVSVLTTACTDAEPALPPALDSEALRMLAACLR